MEFGAIARAANAWRDRRTVKKYSDAAHVMNHAAHVDALLDQYPHNHQFKKSLATDAANTLENVPNKTSKRIDKLAADPALKAKVDKGLGLNTSNDIW
jgi:hypothetical protein